MPQYHTGLAMDVEIFVTTVPVMAYFFDKDCIM